MRNSWMQELLSIMKTTSTTITITESSDNRIIHNLFDTHRYIPGFILIFQNTCSVHDYQTIPAPIYVYELIGDVKSIGSQSDGILIRMSEFDLEVVVSHALEPKVWHIRHSARLAGHSGERKMYSTTTQTLYWPDVAVVCHGIAFRCGPCTQS